MGLTVTHPMGIWRCPTCGLPLELPTCSGCDRGPSVDGRLLNFTALTPSPGLGLKDVLLRTHEALADSYEDLAASPRVRRAIDRIGRESDGGLCLEIGAANGPMTVALEGLFDQVIALDHSERLLRKVLGRTRSAVCAVADAEFPPIRDGCVDFAVLTEVLEHAVVPTQLLLELRRVLKPRGRAFITVPNERILNPFSTRPKGPLDDTHVNFLDSAGLVRLVSRCGLEVMDVRTASPDLTAAAILKNPWRLRKLLPACGRYVECVVRPAADPLACWREFLERRGVGSFPAGDGA
jgi:SAM-dependent methyltransferase